MSLFIADKVISLEGNTTDLIAVATRFLQSLNFEYDDFTKDDDYLIKTPKQIETSGSQICYDMVEYLRAWFDKRRVKTRTFFICARPTTTETRTHTVLLFEDSSTNKWWWFEYSWVPNRGIHGPFISPAKAVGVIAQRLGKDWSADKVHLAEYTKFNYAGMTINQFSQHLMNTLTFKQIRVI